MSVELNISVEENCDSIYFYDRTGKYDPKCNKTGWCAPNQEISEATEAEVHIYLPKAEEPIILDFFPDFPNMENEGYEILPEDLGLEKFPSGIWRFDYFVRVSSGLLTASCQKLFTKDLECCINKKTVEVTPDNFDSKEVKESNEINLLFESAILNSCEGEVAKAQKIVDFLSIKCKCKC